MQILGLILLCCLDQNACRVGRRESTTVEPTDMVRTVVEKRVNEIGRGRRHDRLARTHDISKCGVKTKHIKNITSRRGKYRMTCAKWAGKGKDELTYRVQKCEMLRLNLTNRD